MKNSTSPGVTMFKTLVIIHRFLLIGLVLTAGVFYFLNNGNLLTFTDHDDPLIYVVTFAALAGILVGHFFFKRQLLLLNSKNTLKEKLTGYQAACIIRYALIEGPALLSIVVFYISGNLFYLTIALILIIYFWLLQPSKQKLTTDLQLNMTLKREFEHLS